MEDVLLNGGELRNAYIDEPVKIRALSLKGGEIINCIFLNQFEIIDAVFEGPVSFESCTFEKGPVFRGTKFRDWAMFRGAIFGNRADFSLVEFLSGVSFASGDSVDLNGHIVEAVSFRHLNFKNAFFRGYVTFNNRNITRSTNFSDARFDDPPHFHNCDLHPGTRFHNAAFSVPKTKDDRRLSQAEDAFRTLRRAMSGFGDIDGRYAFWSLELATRLRKRKTSWVEKCLIAMYWAASDYGRSVARPLAGFVALFLGMASLLFAMNWPMENALPKWEAFLQLVFEQTVRPFSIWDVTYVVPLSIGDAATLNSFGLKLALTAYSLSVLVLFG